MNINSLTVRKIMEIISCYDKTPEGFQEFITSCDVASENALTLFSYFWK
jgi:hypothetical protein